MPSQLAAEVVLGRLDPTERAWVETFRDGLRRMLGSRLRDLRLFGSKVRGDDHEESDIDLLVLVDQLDYQTQVAIIDLASSIAAWLSPAVADFDGYHAPRSRATGFYEEMRRDSVRL